MRAPSSRPPRERSSFPACCCAWGGLLLGICIALVYMFRNTYSTSFAVTLELLSVMVQTVVMLVNVNLGAVPVGAGQRAEDWQHLFRHGRGAGHRDGISCVRLPLPAARRGDDPPTLALPLRRRTEKELKITISKNLDYAGLFDDLFRTYTNGAELVQVKTSNMAACTSCTTASSPGMRRSKKVF